MIKMDKQTFAIIIILTTVISYLIIRKFFSIAPRYIMYGILGLVVGLTISITIAWPISAFFGQFGTIVAPYILGLILMVFVELFIVEGRNIIIVLQERFQKR
ncbi:MAG: hypothetical protein PHU42_03260 [Patescibacteria group bacterium]|nr:hypothetical protein [Patescibacteria group bacterium]